jgi:hypothetical protein
VPPFVTHDHEPATVIALCNMSNSDDFVVTTIRRGAAAGEKSSNSLGILNSRLR